MLTFIVGVVVGVVLAGLGILTLPKLKTAFAALKAKLAKAEPVTVTTPPVLTPVPTVTATAVPVVTP